MAMISLFDKKKGNDEMSVKWGQLALFNPSIMYGACLIFVYYICLIFVWGQFALFNLSIAAYSRIAGAGHTATTVAHAQLYNVATVRRCVTIGKKCGMILFWNLAASSKFSQEISVICA